MMSYNTFILEKLIELFFTKFHAAFSSQTFYMFPCLLLNHSFPLLKHHFYASRYMCGRMKLESHSCIIL